MCSHECSHDVQRTVQGFLLKHQGRYARTVRGRHVAQRRVQFMRMQRLFDVHSSCPKCTRNNFTAKPSVLTHSTTPYNRLHEKADSIEFFADVSLTKRKRFAHGGIGKSHAAKPPLFPRKTFVVQKNFAAVMYGTRAPNNITCALTVHKHRFHVNHRIFFTAYPSRRFIQYMRL